MGFDILLAATLQALLGVLAHAGLADKVEEHCRLGSSCRTQHDTKLMVNCWVQKR